VLDCVFGLCVRVLLCVFPSFCYAAIEILRWIKLTINPTVSSQQHTGSSACMCRCHSGHAACYYIQSGIRGDIHSEPCKSADQQDNRWFNNTADRRTGQASSTDWRMAIARACTHAKRLGGHQAMQTTRPPVSSDFLRRPTDRSINQIRNQNGSHAQKRKTRTRYRISLAFNSTDHLIYQDSSYRETETSYRTSLLNRRFKMLPAFYRATLCFARSLRS